MLHSAYRNSHPSRSDTWAEFSLLFFSVRRCFAYILQLFAFSSLEKRVWSCRFIMRLDGFGFGVSLSPQCCWSVNPPPAGMLGFSPRLFPPLRVQPMERLPLHPLQFFEGNQTFFGPSAMATTLSPPLVLLFRIATSLSLGGRRSDLLPSRDLVSQCLAMKPINRSSSWQPPSTRRRFAQRLNSSSPFR